MVGIVGCVVFVLLFFVGVPGSRGTSDKTLQDASERVARGEAGLRTFGFVRLTGCPAWVLQF